MEPEFVFPVVIFALATALGFVFGRIGAAWLSVLVAALCLVAAYVLVFHSIDLLGWEGMGPGIVAMLGFVPSAGGAIAGGMAGYILRCRSGRGRRG